MECPAPLIETVFWWRDTNKNSKFDVKGGA